jgi:hypothetical protein
VPRLCSATCRNGVILANELAEIRPPAINDRVRLPPAMFPVPANAGLPRLVGFEQSTIQIVLPLRCLANVRPAVVKPVAVTMIALLTGLQLKKEPVQPDAPLPVPHPLRAYSIKKITAGLKSVPFPLVHPLKIFVIDDGNLVLAEFKLLHFLSTILADVIIWD